MPTLSSWSRLRRHLGLSDSDTTDNDVLQEWLEEAEQLIREYIHLDLACPPRIYTEHATTWNSRFQRLRQRPVRAFLLTGTLTANSAIVTGLTGLNGVTANSLLVGMPINMAGENRRDIGFVPGTTISSIDSATQVTASTSSQSTGSANLYCGCAVWLDRRGYYGAGPDAFGSTSALTPGIDYLVKPDQPDGTSRSGLLERISGVWPPAVEYNRGLLAPSMVEAKGVLRVQYCAGFAQVPKDLELATNLVAARIMLMRKSATLTSESWDGYSASLTLHKRPLDPLEPAMSILTRWKSLALGV